MTTDFLMRHNTKLLVIVTLGNIYLSFTSGWSGLMNLVAAGLTGYALYLRWFSNISELHELINYINNKSCN
jgi:hypothetical protein